MPRNNRPRRRSDANASSGPAVMLSGAVGSASAPRSKAGCWTCRIRRKRCDEQQDENGSCQACVRLDIECLGWGQRRPDWCRDKDKLTEYKLRLKRKLCSRAGTRPSAATLAARQQQSTTQQLGTSQQQQQQRRIDDHQHDITRAPSGESPSTTYSRSDDEMDHRNAVNGTGFDEEEETDDSWAFNSAFYASPLFPQSALPQPTTTTTTNNVTHTQLPLHPFSPSFTSPSVSVSVASVNALSQKLHAHLPSILAKSPLPAEYHTLTTQLLDLLSYKTFSSPSSSTCLNAEQEIAQRARKIDEALTRLNNRNAFDGSFESMTGFEFNPIAFLTASNITPSSVGGSSVYSASPLVDPYSSPLGMSSPDLIYETFSQFSGSSAPTSPAAPMLAMTASPAMLSSSSPLGVGSPLLYGYQPQTGFDSYQSLNAFSFNASTSTSSSSTGSGGYDSTPSSASTLSMGMGMTTAADDGLMMMGALGLSNDFFAQTDYSATGAMSFTLPPPPSTAPAKPMPLITTTTTTAPSTPSPSTSIAQQQDSDPLQIHYDSCSLLLQSILSSSSSSSVEETLQRLTSKFSSMITNPSISSSPSMAPLTTAVKPEYLFSATLAGALCPKNSYRRDLFRRVVRGIEERQLGPGAVGEAGLLLDQI